MLKTHSSSPQALLLGFDVGRQPMEITEALRMIFQKAHEWGLALIIFKGDIANAFVAMEHPLLDQSFAARSVPVCLRAATLRGLVGLTLKVQLQSVTTDEIPLGKGGPQGGAGIPSWWNFLFDFVLTPVIQSWKQNNFGFDLEDGLDPLSLLGWADDTFWIATFFHDAAIMTQELTYAINDSCLTWKGDSLSFLANDSALEQWPPGLPTDRFYALGRDLCPFTFHRVDEMPALGVLLGRTGSTTRAVEHRVCAGFAHFYARRPQFTCRRVSLRKRILRVFSTVAKSVLWGAGGWTVSQPLLQRLETFGFTLLRRMLSLPGRPGEGFLEHMLRTPRAARQALNHASQRSLAVLALEHIHGWAGHVARLPKDAPVARALHFRCLTWWRPCQATLGSSDPTNRTGWKHSTPGYKTRWEEPLEKLDAGWISRASDRDTWRSLRGRFVSTLHSRHHCRNSVYHPTARDAPPAPEKEKLNMFSLKCVHCCLLVSRLLSSLLLSPAPPGPST